MNAGPASGPLTVVQPVDHAAHRRDRRRFLLDLLLLAALAAAFYLPGLDHHGVTNWQEAQRLIVARDMQSRWRAGEGVAALVVPTVYGRPYLAKPPMVYWAQLLLAEPFGARVQLAHLRLAVALGGIAGVLATYWCARVLFPGRGSRAIGWWSALFLATGLLSTRSARIGELDVFLMPTCTAAITCIALAWRTCREQAQRGTHWAAVAGASAFAALAVMVKDPAIMIIGFGGFAAIALFIAATGEPAVRKHARVLRAAVSTFAGTAAGLYAARTADGPADVIGAAIDGVAVGLLVRALLPLADPTRLRMLVRALLRTHPVVVLGLPVAARLGWAAWVDHLAGAAASGASARAEAEDNLRLFIAEAPLNNLQAAAYGVGLGSLAALGVLVWLVRRPPRLTPGGAHLVAWIGLGLLAFSILGKGVPRYLTPMWPAIAIVGGWGVSELLRRASAATARAPSWLATAIAAAALMLGAAQTAWYGYGREVLEGERSPRAMMDSLRKQVTRRERRAVYSFEFTTPALDYHLGFRVRPLGDVRAGLAMTGGASWSLDRLRRVLQRPLPDGRPRTAIVLARDRPVAGVDPRPVAERLEEAGLAVERIDLPGTARFEIDRGRAAVEAWRVRLAPAAQPRR